MRTRCVLSLSAALVVTGAVAAQTPIELSVNNSLRVISNSRHPTTNNPYPAAVTTPTSYNTQPGIPAGFRAWTYTPKLRAQGGHQSPNYWTVTGMTMAIFTGAAVQQFPAPNHYQFKAGIAPTVPQSNPRLLQHAPTGADIFSIAQAPVSITAWGIVEHSVSLTTPVPLADTELLLFVEFAGGEWRDDPMGGQFIGNDWQGGNGPPGILSYQGFATAGNPRTVTPVTAYYRPKIGLHVQEAVLTATGYHANGYYTPPTPQETYRSLGACYADYARLPNGNGSLFFDIRAGDIYGSTGMAVVLLNIGTWFPGAIPSPFGNLLLNPGDPALGFLTSFPMLLTAGGVFDQGATSPLPVPALGNGARGVVLKAQGFVFNAGFADAKLTSASSIEIY